MNHHSCDEIVKNLYVGSRHTYTNSPLVFSMIVNCTPDIPFPDYCMHTIRIPIQDDPDEVPRLLRILQDLHVLETMHRALKENQRVLVHCSAGIQRSCAVVACYLVEYRGLTAEEAVEYIRRKRPIAFHGGSNFWDAIHTTELMRSPSRRPNT